MGLWLVILNAAAGFYSGVFWGWLCLRRIVMRMWARAFGCLVLATASLVVGEGFYLLARGRESATTWLHITGYLVGPLLVLPVTLHLTQWSKAQSMIWEAEKKERSAQVARSESSETEAQHGAGAA